MNFYQVTLAEDDGWHVKVDSDSLPLDIWACEHLSTPSLAGFCIGTEGDRVDFSHTGWGGIPIISNRMGSCLESIAPHDIQRIEAIIPGEPNGRWEVLNVLAKPDCISHEKSKISHYPARHPKAGKPRGVLRLVLDEERVGGHHVFRPKDWGVAIVISEVVKTALDAQRITGIEYWPTRCG